MLLTYQPLVLAGFAAALWLLCGGVLVGPRYPVIRRRIDEGTSAAADAFDRCADASYTTRDNWARGLSGVVKTLAAKVVRPSWPAPSIDPDRSGSNLPPVVLACFTGLLLAAACATNYALLSDILPELAGVAPADRIFPRLGWWIAITSPAVIVGGEAIGGLISTQYAAGRHLFIGCLVFEILAALRRAVDYALESAFEPGQMLQLSPAGAVQGATFIALAVLLPIVIYRTGAFLEPAFRALSGMAVVGAAGRWLGLIVRNLPFAIAIAVISLTIVVQAVVLTAVALAFAAVAWIVRNVVRLIAVALVALAIGLPTFVIARVLEIVRPARLTTAMLLMLLPLIGGCNTAPVGASTAPMSFDEMSLAEGAKPLAPQVVLAIPAHQLTMQLLRLAPVKKIKEPSLFVCIVDATGSVPASQRDRMLRSCAHRTALAPPEVTGAVVLVGDAGWSSAMPVVWRPAASNVTRCQTDPALPEISAPTMLYERALQRARAQIELRLKQCQQEVAAERARAAGEMVRALPAFVEHTVATLGRRLYHSTDLFGTLSRVEDLERAVEDTQGQMARIDIELVSDLFDAANGCEFRDESSGSVTIVCEGSAVRSAQTLLSRHDVHAKFLQVVPAAQETRRRSEQWRLFWSSLAPAITVATWSEFAGPNKPVRSAGGKSES